MGGIGVFSAGLLGGPGIGYKQDYFASTELKQKAPIVYEEYKASGKSRFLLFETQGLDGSKIASVRAKAPGQRDEKENLVHEADLHGGRMALKVTAAVPATMALMYLLLILYFKAKGGYRQVQIKASP